MRGSPLHPSQRSPLAFHTAVVVESRAPFTKRSLVALTKLLGRIFVNEIWALASDAPNVTSVAGRGAEQPETIETSWDGKETCLSSKAETFTNICYGLSGSMRLGNS
jgi:hypothetical protein